MLKTSVQLFLKETAHSGDTTINFDTRKLALNSF